MHISLFLGHELPGPTNKEREMTAEFRNCEATILHNAFSHNLCNDGWPPTALLIMHMLSTCCKLHQRRTICLP